MRKLFYFLAMSAIVLGMAFTFNACGGNDANNPEPRRFKMNISKVSDTSCKVEIQSPGEDVFFTDGFATSEEFLKNPRGFVQNRLNAYKEENKPTYPEGLHAEIERSLNDLDPETEYVIYVCEVNEEYQAVGNVEHKRVRRGAEVPEQSENNSADISINVLEIGEIDARISFSYKNRNIRYTRGIIEKSEADKRQLGVNNLISYLAYRLEETFKSTHGGQSRGYSEAEAKELCFKKQDADVTAYFPSLKPQTDYLIYAVGMDENDELIADSWTTKTIRTAEMKPNRSPVGAWWYNYDYRGSGKIYYFDEQHNFLLDTRRHTGLDQYKTIYRGTYDVTGEFITLHFREICDCPHISSSEEFTVRPLISIEPYDEKIKYAVAYSLEDEKLIYITEYYESENPSETTFIFSENLFNEYLHANETLDFFFTWYLCQ